MEARGLELINVFFDVKSKVAHAHVGGRGGGLSPRPTVTNNESVPWDDECSAPHRGNYCYWAAWHTVVTLQREARRHGSLLSGMGGEASQDVNPIRELDATSCPSCRVTAQSRRDDAREE